jgi:hypothetical protein
MSASAYGQMYKWTDKDGKIHYSDKPPSADAKQERITQPPTARPPSVESKGRAGPSAGRCSDLDSQLNSDAAQMDRLRFEMQQSGLKKDVQRYCTLSRQFVDVNARGLARMRANVGSCGITQRHVSEAESQNRLLATQHERMCR